MKNEITIYHGSDHIIETPQYGEGKPYNDYGRGFYCTEYVELAKEWACSDPRGGYANKYVLHMNGMKVLDLNGGDYGIIHWISVLLKNRQFTIDNDFGNAAREYILNNFAVETEGYDIIKGYRADDSYFSYARDFLQNGISVRRLAQVMRLGELGNQIVLVSPRAFSQIRFVGCEEARGDLYFPARKRRDDLERRAYLSDRQGGAWNPDDILMIDIMREGMKANDPRLQ